MSKTQDKKTEAKAVQAPAEKTKEQIRLTRMRTRDFLADAIIKVAKQEIAAQKAALAEKPDRPHQLVTLDTQDCKNGIAALDAIEMFYKGFSPVAGGVTEQNVWADLAKGRAILAGLLSGKVKAMTPSEEAKHKASKAEAAKKALQAQADLAALEAADNLL